MQGPHWGNQLLQLRDIEPARRETRVGAEPCEKDKWNQTATDCWCGTVSNLASQNRAPSLLVWLSWLVCAISLSVALKRRWSKIIKRRRLRTRRLKPPSPSSKQRRPTCTSTCLTWRDVSLSWSSWSATRRTEEANHDLSYALDDTNTQKC